MVRLRVFIGEIEELAGSVGIIGDMFFRDEFADPQEGLKIG